LGDHDVVVVEWDRVVVVVMSSNSGMIASLGMTILPDFLLPVFLLPVFLLPGMGLDGSISSNEAVSLSANIGIRVINFFFKFAVSFSSFICRYYGHIVIG
jgi:hypothetical protein